MNEQYQEFSKHVTKDDRDALREMPYPSTGITYDCLRHVVVYQLWNDDSFTSHFTFLHETLSEMGMEFFYPGGSIQRRICVLLRELFGLEDSEESRYLKNTNVRIGLDAFADEVIKRCQRAK